MDIGEPSGRGVPPSLDILSIWAALPYIWIWILYLASGPLPRSLIYLGGPIESILPTGVPP